MVHGFKILIAFTAVGLLLTGCASTNKNGDGIADPIEKFNRSIFKFNDVVDTAVLKPVAEGYRAGVPKPARVGVRNVLRNLKSPQIVANDLLQGNLKAACDGTTRFFANTLLGLGGIFDVAGNEGVKYKEEDFGQTMGVWGAGTGPYVVLPLFGPSSVRDTAGLAVDMYTDPVRLVLENTDHYVASYTRSAITVVDKREEFLDVVADLKKNSIDYYAATKSAYTQRRAAQISNNGENAQLADMP
jgi:phospholipid-binding lipoprotein MlaA